MRVSRAHIAGWLLLGTLGATSACALVAGIQDTTVDAPAADASLPPDTATGSDGTTSPPADQVSPDQASPPDDGGVLPIPFDATPIDAAIDVAIDAPVD